MPDADEPPLSVDRTTVLVVTGDADLRALARTALSSTYRLLEAATGPAGLAKARAELPDLIVSEVQPGGVDGLHLIREVRDDPAAEGLPVLLLAAGAGPDDELAGLLAGADDYLCRAPAAKVLWARVGNLMARQHRLRERLRGGPPNGNAPASPPASSFEQDVRRVVNEHLGDSDFSVEQLAGQLALDRSYLSRKLSREVGRSPTELIRRMRLQRGAELLSARTGDISEVAYAVGFNSLSYFSRCFRKHFGTTPSQYTNAEP